MLKVAGGGAVAISTLTLCSEPHMEAFAEIYKVRIDLKISK
jgi:hypothetical protein